MNYTSQTSQKNLKNVIHLLDQALSSLCVKLSAFELEKRGVVIVDCMSGPSRLYHRPDHILDLAQGLDSIGVLAALYHDVVYFQVDGGIPSVIHSKIAQYFSVINGAIYINEFVENPLFELCLDIFAFTPSQKMLVHKGQNEFLSALVFLEEFTGILTPAQMMQVISCIEATIPFRGDESPMEKLEDRLNRLNIKHQLGFLEEEIIPIVERATQMANKDVDNFSDSDVAHFLDSTWKLMPEMNARLIHSKFYSIKEYRLTIQKMQSFLANLQPSSIYLKYHNEPTAENYKKILQKSEINLKLGEYYLRIKLFSIVIVECLSQITGGDAPLIHFMGERNEDKDSDEKTCLSDFLPPLSKPKFKVNETILDLFEYGRKNSSTFDLKTSPVSAYIYKILGDEGLVPALDSLNNYCLGKLTPMAFLKLQNKELIQAISKACAEIAFTRKLSLQALNWNK